MNVALSPASSSNEARTSPSRTSTGVSVSSATRAPGLSNSTPPAWRSARCRSRPKSNRGAHSSSNRIRPRTLSTRRIRRSRRAPSRRSPTGMKSWTSPTPAGVRKRVISTLVSGKYSCLFCHSPSAGRSAKCPPRSASSNEANMLGESNRGEQYQSIVPSVLISATVWRLPITPWSAIGG